MHYTYERPKSRAFVDRGATIALNGIGLVIQFLRLAVLVFPFSLCIAHEADKDPQVDNSKDLLWISGGIKAPLTPKAKARVQRVFEGKVLPIKDERLIASFGKPVGGFSVGGKRYCFLTDRFWPDRAGFDHFWRDELFARLTDLIAGTTLDGDELAQLVLSVLELDESRIRQSESRALPHGEGGDAKNTAKPVKGQSPVKDPAPPPHKH